MTPAENRRVKPIPERLKQLVPKPTDNLVTVKPGHPDVEKDTIPLIVEKTKRTAWQTKKLAETLEGKTFDETLRNNSNFILDYIAYKKDDSRHEQIRSPRRLVHEGVGDCDCYAVFLATVLRNQGIKFYYRITNYRPGDWAHIYIVVPNNQQSLSVERRTDYTVLDPVTNRHDHEVKFNRKKDFDMSLQYLDGYSAPVVTPGTDGLGCCCDKPSSANNNPKPNNPKTGQKNKVMVLSGKALQNRGIKNASEILDRTGMPYQKFHNAEGIPFYQVQTPAGNKVVPAFVSTDKQEQENILQSITTPFAETASSLVEAATPAIEEIKDNLTVKKVVPWLLGLGLFTAVVGTFRSKPKGVSGLGALPKKKVSKLATVRM